MSAIQLGFALGVTFLATACNTTDSTQPKKAGSYTAARHSQIGSHIPQPENASSGSNTAMSDAEIEREAQRQSSISVGSNASIGGGR